MEHLTFTLTQTTQLWLFFVLVLGIIALPGMDMAFVLGSTLVDGRRGGLAALAGIVAGGVAHTAMAALGVGAHKTARDLGAFATRRKGQSPRSAQHITAAPDHGNARPHSCS